MKGYHYWKMSRQCKYYCHWGYFILYFGSVVQISNGACVFPTGWYEPSSEWFVHFDGLSEWRYKFTSNTFTKIFVDVNNGYTPERDIVHNCLESTQESSDTYLFTYKVGSNHVDCVHARVLNDDVMMWRIGSTGGTSSIPSQNCMDIILSDVEGQVYFKKTINYNSRPIPFPAGAYDGAYMVSDSSLGCNDLSTFEVTVSVEGSNMDFSSTCYKGPISRTAPQKRVLHYIGGTTGSFLDSDDNGDIKILVDDTDNGTLWFYCMRSKLANNGEDITFTIESRSAIFAVCIAGQQYDEYDTEILYTLTLQNDCENAGEYSADPNDQCYFVLCNSQLQLQRMACAPGSAVPEGFVSGTDNPCSLQVQGCGSCEFHDSWWLPKKWWFGINDTAEPAIDLIQTYNLHATSTNVLGSDDTITPTRTYSCKSYHHATDAVDQAVYVRYEQSDDTIRHCVTETYVNNTDTFVDVIYHQEMVVGNDVVAGDCETQLSTTKVYSIFFSYPLGELSYDCPFPSGSYHASARSTDFLCVDDPLSTVTIAAGTIQLSMCNEYLLDMMAFTCVATLNAENINANWQEDFIILESDGRYYCARYSHQSGLTYLSVDVTSNGVNGLTCSGDSTDMSVGQENGRDYVQFKFSVDFPTTTTVTDPPTQPPTQPPSTSTSTQSTSTSTQSTSTSTQSTSTSTQTSTSTSTSTTTTESPSTSTTESTSTSTTTTSTSSTTSTTSIALSTTSTSSAPSSTTRTTISPIPTTTNERPSSSSIQDYLNAEITYGNTYRVNVDSEVLFVSALKPQLAEVAKVDSRRITHVKLTEGSIIVQFRIQDDLLGINSEQAARNIQKEIDNSDLTMKDHEDRMLYPIKKTFDYWRDVRLCPGEICQSGGYCAKKNGTRSCICPPPLTGEYCDDHINKDKTLCDSCDVFNSKLVLGLVLAALVALVIGVAALLCYKQRHDSLNHYSIYDVQKGYHDVQKVNTEIYVSTAMVKTVYNSNNYVNDAASGIQYFNRNSIK